MCIRLINLPKAAFDDLFQYDSEGNLIEDLSKSLKISYDWRGMPVEFLHETGDNSKDYKLLMAYDGSGRRISKTRLRRDLGASDWAVENVTHYTGIGTEVRETHVNGLDETKVVVNLPQGLGRYTPEDAVDGLNGVSGSQLAGYRPPAKFEWYLKNHLGSTMLVYGTQPYNDKYSSYAGGVKAAYDYRAFGEQVDLAMPTDKVTENFTGKEKDDETELNYFGARYLDPMLGMWTSVDPARQFASPYLYAGNGMNPLNAIDPDGNYSLNLNEDNTVASMTSDEYDNAVSVLDANGSLLGNYAAPPAESYFFAKTNGQYNIVGQNFDFSMQQNAMNLVNDAAQYWPFDFVGWGTGGPFDFKNAYYPAAHNTVGVLNGTIMTARDVGNAAWGGYTRYNYLCMHGCLDPLSQYVAHDVMEKISNHVAKGGIEDCSSAVMQSWGFDNFKPNNPFKQEFGR